MLKLNLPLILGRELPDLLPCNSPQIIIDNSLFINGLIPTRGQLPANPPFEINPYKQDFPLENFEKYIIGTFPPISYILDNILISAVPLIELLQPIDAGGNNIRLPRIPFYHGNRGSMWDFLLTTPELAALNIIINGVNGRQNAKNFLINFLRDNKINYADIIDSTQRNLINGRYNAGDKNLNNICPNNDLICHILSNPNAKYLLFNTSSIFSNQGIIFTGANFIDVDANTKSFDLFVRQCQELSLEIQIRIRLGNPATQFPWTNLTGLTVPQRRTKLIFEMKIKNPMGNLKLNCDFKQGSERIFTIMTPFSPAAVDRGALGGNLIVNNWLLLNPGQTKRDMLSLIYQNFRNNIFLPNYIMNV